MTPEEAADLVMPEAARKPEWKRTTWDEALVVLADHARATRRVVPPAAVWGWERLAAGLVDRLCYDGNVDLARELFGELLSARGWLNGNGPDEPPWVR